MGYDLMFEKAKDASSITFPCEYGEFEMEPNSFPWAELKKRLLEMGAKENSGPDTLILEVPDRGTIYVTGSNEYAHLDMHAEWSLVKDLFEWIRSLDPNVVLADTNEGVYYDPISFDAFARECGADS